ncbi:MAG: HAD hydrolase family protein, partial [Lachnospiraceae bacterium]|nr:HAD hydrolase family protein [Lachnospiraceae bacterium]
MIKAVFFDIDGTLTAFGTTIIPEDTRLALRLLKEKGIRIFVATGRYLPDLNIVTKENLDFDGYVILNGQACVDSNLNIIYEHDLSKDIDAIVDIFNKKEVS